MAMHRNVMGLIAAVCVGIASTYAVAASKPDATLKLTGKSVAVGVGFSWGNGTLNYHGKHYSFSVDGLAVGDVGASSITATGNVYHLKRIEDFSGNYTAASAGAAVGGGGGASSMRNANGVVINLKATQRGVEFKAGVDGVKLKLK
jgi:hypothetical protein